MQASIRDMKNRLSQYLRRVRAGREVVITDRGRPVARLVPMGPETSAEADIAARTLALPWVRPGKGGKPKGSRTGFALRGKGPTAAEVVLQDRE